VKIRALRLYNVRCFAGRGMALENMGNGVNVLCAANEAGKSTSFAALHALFFYPYSTTRKEMQSLRPYSGGNPLIEADIVTNQGEFRLTKQYHGRNFARVQDLTRQRLIAQDDEAEHFIANLMKADSTSPAGLLWLRQGANIVDKQTSGQEASEQQARLGLLQSVQGEVDAITGGRRMDAIMSKVADELGNLVTQKGPKAGGRYACALETVEQLEAEEQRLRTEVFALRQALDERHKLRKRLSECDDPQTHAAHMQEIEAAQQAFDQAKLHQEKVKTAEAMLKLARQAQDLAKQTLENFLQTCKKQTELQQKLQQVQIERDQALTKHRQTINIIEQLHLENEKISVQIHAHQQQLTQMEMADQYRQLQQQYHQAQQLDQTLQQAKLTRSLIKITPQAWEELHAIDIEIATLQAIIKAKSPSLRVSYQQQGVTLIKLNGVEVKGETQYFYDGDLHNTQAVAAISSSTGNSLAQLEARRQELLSSFKVKTLDQARRALKQAQELDIELAKLRFQFEQCAPQGLTALHAQYLELEAMLDKKCGKKQRIETQMSDSIESHSALEQIRALLAAAEQRRHIIALDIQSRQAQHLAQQNQFVSLEGALASLMEQLSQTQIITGGVTEQEANQRELSDQLESTTLALTAARQQYEDLQNSKMDLQAAKIRLQRLQSAQTAKIQEINILRENLAGLNAAIDTHCDQAVEEKWLEVRDRLTTARNRLDGERHQLAVLQHLSHALEAARADARDFYLLPIMRELKPLLALLFDDIDVEFDEKTLLPRRIRRAGREEDIERLSGGMREQISILTRLAFARLLARDGREVPIILDDALMFDALHAQAHSQQIIVFSCRSRAFARLGGTILHMQNWNPSI